MELVKLVLQVLSEFGVALMILAGGVYLLVRELRKNRRTDKSDDLTDREKKKVSEASSWLLDEMTKQFTAQNTTIDRQNSVINAQADRLQGLSESMWTQVSALQSQLAMANGRAAEAMSLLRRVKRASDDLLEGGHIDQALAPLTDFLRDDGPPPTLR